MYLHIYVYMYIPKYDYIVKKKFYNFEIQFIL